MKIITFNLRNHSDRWEERFPLVRQLFLQENADLVAFQEVSLMLGEKNQAELIAKSLNDELGRDSYKVYFTEGRGWLKGKEGIAVLSKLPLFSFEEKALPKKWRVAQKIQFKTHEKTVSLFNTHLHHEPEFNERIRYPQAQAVLKWVRGANTPSILVGDMNAAPASTTINLFKQSMVSAYAKLHGKEPEYTWPTPLIKNADQMEAAALDYIFLSEADFDIGDCRLIGTKPLSSDPSLYTSDHFGVCVELNLHLLS